MHIQELTFCSTDGLSVAARLRQESAILFQPSAQIQLLATGRDAPVFNSRLAETRSIAWLPRGEYLLRCRLPRLDLPAGDYRLRLVLSAEIAGRREVLTETTIAVHRERSQAQASAADDSPQWSVRATEGATPIEDLAWSRGHADWFFRHFDHAALVVTDYMLQQHPLLRGRILDVGCGDGIIDLGIFLRMQPQELVGIDPFEGYRRLPEALRANHLPQDLLDDPRLRYLPADANAIPYPDDHFDVVVSWGSLEHIAGGYDRALREIRRVLKRDGLLFVHPGLYYGALGNHLGEFFDDPFVHLKLPREQLREAVLKTEPKRMDRAGHIATPEEYWQWYTELNPIRVTDFERQLRELGFEPWRVAVRSSDLVEYTPELQGHSMLDLATAELYLSAWNRK